MYVSIRDDMVLATGFDTVADGLKFYAITGVELGIDRAFRVHALTPTADRTHLFLNDPDDIARLSDQAAEAGVRIAALLMPNNFNAPDIDVELAWAVQTVRAAAQLGAPAVRIDAIMQGERDLPIEERHAIFARGVHRILRETDGLPVDLGIENHGFQGNDPAFLNGLMDQVGSSRLGMTLDTGNFYWAGHPLDTVYEILRDLAPVAKHTHIKNIKYPPEIVNTRRAMGFEYGKYNCPIPEGDIDHAKVVGYLKAAGYDRDLCIEDESLGKFEPEQRRVHVRNAVDHLNSCILNV